MLATFKNFKADYVATDSFEASRGIVDYGIVHRRVKRSYLEVVNGGTQNQVREIYRLRITVVEDFV